MKIFCKTRKSHRWNEDRFICGSNYCIVIDGATPLKKCGQFNSARWFVDYIKKNINKRNADVNDSLLSVCNEAYRRYPNENKTEDYLPSASACWAQWVDETLRIGILGDCEATLITKDGKIIRCHDSRLNVLDSIAKAEMVKAAAIHSTTVLGARKYINDILINHRKLANKANGYPALVLSPDVEINEKTFTFALSEIQTIYLYSDGFSQAFENLNIYNSHEDMFKQIKDIDEEIAKIVDASYADKNGNAHPRFKVIDDITAVKIEINRV